jgi:hypothetical protein
VLHAATASCRFRNATLGVGAESVLRLHEVAEYSLKLSGKGGIRSEEMALSACGDGVGGVRASSTGAAPPDAHALPRRDDRRCAGRGCAGILRGQETKRFVA